MKLEKVTIIQVSIISVCIVAVGALVFCDLVQQADGGPETYVARPTFYDLPAIVYSDSRYTEEIKEHISYCTFNYDLTTNISHIANASNDVPIIVDGYSLDVKNDQDLVAACSKAVLNGSVLITLWENVADFMQQVRYAAYGPSSSISFPMGESILSIGFWNGNNGVQPSESTATGSVGTYGPSMTTLTQSYEWCVRMVNDQPYHPTLYP